MRLIIEVKNPTTKVKSIYSVLFRWDISLALNMTYFFLLVFASVAKQSPGRAVKSRHSERSEESHRRTDEHILYRFGRGIFR